MSERLATTLHNSVLQGMDVRAHLLTTLAFLVCVLSFDRYSVSSLMPFALYPALLAALGNIPLRTVARAVLVALPFIFFVGIWNPIFDTHPMLTLGSFTLTGGWLSFFSILVRCILCVSAVTILTRLCGFAPLCAALPRLGVPRIFATQLLLLHQALFLLMDEAVRMRRARDLRAFGRRGQGLRATAPLIGNFLLRSLDRAERVHTAMLCRGFNGIIPMPVSTRFGMREIVFCGISCVFFVFARVVDIPAALERGFVLFIGAVS